jgi:tetratricopeptide (TPR) repeat protein
LSGRNNNDRAIEQWEIAVELAPEKPQPRFALADAYFQAGQKAKAKEMLKKLLKITPNYPGADVLLESIEKGEK